jgi:hypothetical protein
MVSPYEGLPIHEWSNQTTRLIAAHPLDTNALYAIVLQAWTDIFASRIGSFQIGQDIFPQPQMMGFFLHELIPLKLQHQYPNSWQRNRSKDEKDLVYLPDQQYSIEIKTSSSRKNIYGNRSYAQVASQSQKTKSGYYLAVNFEKFTAQNSNPQIRMVRFGWIDYEDWRGQTAATGQQARLSQDVERYKLLELPLRK